MADLVVGLILRSTEIEEKTAVSDLALVVVGDRCTGTAAVNAVLDGVVVAASREGRLEVEVNATGSSRGDELVVGDGVRDRDTALIAADSKAGGSSYGNSGKGHCEGVGGAHLEGMWLW